MKKILLFVVISTFAYDVNAQFLDKLSIDLNIARCSKDVLLLDKDHYSNDMSYITGFNISYNSSEKFRHYLGIRKINTNSKMVFLCGNDYSPHEYVRKKGFELNLGTKFSLRSNKRIFLGYGIEIFGEFSELSGNYSYNKKYYSVDHRYSYFGIAPSLALNLRIIDRVLFFIDTKYRFGQVSLTKKDKNRPELYKDKTHWESIFDPINSIGVRFEL